MSSPSFDATSRSAPLKAHTGEKPSDVPALMIRKCWFRQPTLLVPARGAHLREIAEYQACTQAEREDQSRYVDMILVMSVSLSRHYPPLRLTPYGPVPGGNSSPFIFSFTIFPLGAAGRLLRPRGWCRPHNRTSERSDDLGR